MAAQGHRETITVRAVRIDRACDSERRTAVLEPLVTDLNIWIRKLRNDQYGSGNEAMLCLPTCANPTAAKLI